MHTQEGQLTRFFCILQLIYKENRTDGFSKPNRTRGFSQNRTELEKSIQHIPTKGIRHQNLCNITLHGMYFTYTFLYRHSFCLRRTWWDDVKQDVQRVRVKCETC